MFTAQLGLEHPIAIRYPRGRGKITEWEQPFAAIEIGKGITLKEGKRIAVLTVGPIASNATEAISEVESGSNANISHYDTRFVKPLDEKLLYAVFQKHTTIITIEDGMINGGFGNAISQFASANNYTNRLKILGIPDEFPQHGTVTELQNLAGISSEKIAQSIKKHLSL